MLVVKIIKALQKKSKKELRLDLDKKHIFIKISLKLIKQKAIAAAVTTIIV